ncbi:hypothetical protein KMC57_gp52 [Achromobacter phage vB_AxyP_19-32_Axy24]|uniref:Uncharacterized protein n=1 Tax=Achromobacter phage vB_AxyP_19-32_Axy24 TaxID=2591048 RepID=A0A514CWE6_9CAUD|nr:hypothetical protein KMC57_gp52 [Achromobacter phage vB_AxyP_19-32_Axy24]QDH84796.1 hypothetical protein Axy24_066 [Achromobacter phage vB_AxyP_19-32_Axy24]
MSSRSARICAARDFSCSSRSPIVARSSATNRRPSSRDRSSLAAWLARRFRSTAPPSA